MDVDFLRRVAASRAQIDADAAQQASVEERVVAEREEEARQRAANASEAAELGVHVAAELLRMGVPGRAAYVHTVEFQKEDEPYRWMRADILLDAGLRAWSVPPVPNGWQGTPDGDSRAAFRLVMLVEDGRFIRERRPLRGVLNPFEIQNPHRIDREPTGAIIREQAERIERVALKIAAEREAQAKQLHGSVHGWGEVRYRIDPRTVPRFGVTVATPETLHYDRMDTLGSAAGPLAETLAWGQQLMSGR